jgi:hypothetical protein
MSFVFNGKLYYKAEYIKELNSAFFYGCARSIRFIINKKNIPVDHYTYATFSKRENKWSISNENINKASLLLTKEWTEQNVPGFGNNKVELELENAPQLLKLNEEEKIKDENGNVIEIETRGTKTIDGIYFYGKDIEKILMLTNINDTLTSDNSTYKIGIHYKKFIRIIECNTLEYHNKTVNKETIYLTYKGLVKMFITRHNPIADKFQDWAFKTLFTVQMGSKEDKQELCSKMLGADISSVRSFLNCGVTEYSELYLICIGKVKDLSNDIIELKNKNQDDYLFKFGYTSDLYKRLLYHKSTFSKYKNNKLSLVFHCPIDKQYLSQAEVDLKNTFQTFDYVLEHPEYKELVHFSENKLSHFEKIFKSICEKYAGNCKKLQEKVEQNKLIKEQELKEIKYEYDNKLKDTMYKMKELELKLQHETEIKNMEKLYKEQLLSILTNTNKL